MDIKEKMSFLQSIGISSTAIPYSFLENCDSYKEHTSELEQWFHENNSLSSIGMMPVCIKDIIGSTHPLYENKGWLDAFLSTSLGKETIDLFFKHPTYYFKDLKQEKQSSLIHNTPLRVYEINHKYYIKEGNNRILFLKMLYLSELEKSKSELEKEEINKKYTFYMDCNALPKQKESIGIFCYLASKNLKFIRRDKEDYHYLIYDENHTYKIDSYEELEQLFEKSFSLSTCKTKEQLFYQLEKTIYFYDHILPQLNLETIFSKIFPNFAYFKKLYLENKLELKKSVFSSTLSYKSLFEHLEQLANKKEEENFHALFLHYQNFNELYENLIHDPYIKKRITKGKHLQDFLHSFNRIVNFLTSSVLPRSYEEVAKLIIEMDLKQQYTSLLPQLEKEEALEKELQHLNKIAIILEHRDSLTVLCNQYAQAESRFLAEENYLRIDRENLEKMQNTINQKKEELINIKKQKGFMKQNRKKKRNSLEKEIKNVQNEKRDLENATLITYQNRRLNKSKMESALKELHVLCTSDITFSYVECILNDTNFTLPLLYQKIRTIQLQLESSKAKQTLKNLQTKSLKYGIVLKTETKKKY